MDPTNAWVVTRDSEVVHVRLKKAVAEASAAIERDTYPNATIAVVPVLLTKIEDVNE